MATSPLGRLSSTDTRASLVGQKHTQHGKRKIEISWHGGHDNHRNGSGVRARVQRVCVCVTVAGQDGKKRTNGYRKCPRKNIKKA